MCHDINNAHEHKRTFKQTPVRFNMDANKYIQINTTIDLVRRLQIRRRRQTMSGTLKNDKTGTFCE